MTSVCPPSRPCSPATPPSSSLSVERDRWAPTSLTRESRLTCAARVYSGAARERSSRPTASAPEQGRQRAGASTPRRTSSEARRGTPTARAVHEPAQRARALGRTVSYAFTPAAAGRVTSTHPRRARACRRMEEALPVHARSPSASGARTPQRRYPRRARPARRSRRCRTRFRRAPPRVLAGDSPAAAPAVAPSVMPHSADRRTRAARPPPVDG